MSFPRRPVITGVGVLAANGIGKGAFWSALLEGRSGIGPVTQFDAGDLPCRIAGEVKGFNPADFIGRRLKPKRMGRFSQLAVAATGMCIEDAGLEVGALQERDPFPVVLGVSTSAMDLIARKPTFFTASSAIPHAAATALASEFSFSARLHTTSSACASSLDAIHEAAMMIRRGEADLALAGGSDSAVARYVFDTIGQSGMLSSRNNDPEHASRPFDRDRDGGVIAEGAGMAVVENLEHALARGARVYAEISGYGSCSDPVGGEEASGLADTMRTALANSGLHTSVVDAISAHGPSDKHLDRQETAMIKAVFGRRAYDIPVHSIKGSTGNPFGTAGILQVITACMTLEHQTVPPTANYVTPDPLCDLDYVAGAPRRQVVRRILINSHGVGRVNSSLVVERAVLR